jgi:non-specific serine/threonine protein kinase
MALAKKADERYNIIGKLISDLKESSPITLSKAEKSIVVLPFDDLSPDRDQEYFSDGLTEEVISDLSGIGALRVISRSSAMTFKGTKKTAPEIAKQLNVQYVLEGSVRKAGNNLRITAQLIDATKDAHLWAKKYSGTLDDVFDIQEKVSRSIVEALKIKLRPEESKRIRESPIDNAKAYEYYFKAKQAMGYWTEPELEEAIRYLGKGLEIIGENALFYSQLGYIYYQFWNLGYRTEEIYLQKASDYANKIAKIDADSIHGFFLKGTLEMAGGSIRKCLHYFQRVLNGDPNHSEALFWTSIMLGYIGKTASAISFYERVVKIDPLNVMSPFLPQWIKIYEGRFEDALEPIKKLYASNPDFAGNQWLYIMIHVYLNKQDEIFSTIEKIERKMPDSQYSRLFVLLKYALHGKKIKVKLLHPDLEKWARKDASYSYSIAQCFAFIDDKARAFDWLETSIKLGGINYPFLNKYDPLLENIRGEPRFKELMERVKHEWENFEV